MSDDADMAADLQAAANEAAAAHRRPVPKLNPLGWCHACGEDTAGLALFCNDECADEFERMGRQGR